LPSLVVRVLAADAAAVAPEQTELVIRIPPAVVNPRAGVTRPTRNVIAVEAVAVAHQHALDVAGQFRREALVAVYQHHPVRRRLRQRV